MKESITEVFNVLASKSATGVERNQLKELKEDVEDTAEDVHTANTESDLVVKRLGSKIESMVSELEKEVEEVEKEVGAKLQKIDLDGDGVVTADEVAEAINQLKQKFPEDKVQAILNEIDTDKGKYSHSEK
jgi:Ca2+-binding EF-hand superfamily protein